MKVVVIGTGHVGLVTVATLASFGHEVVGYDIDQDKIDEIVGGGSPFYEPGLGDLLDEGLSQGRITFTTDPAKALTGADVAMLCVPTPTGGFNAVGLDLSMVQAAVKTVATHATGPLVLVEKSTVPPGTGDRLDQLIAMYAKDKGITVVSNPEFLREGQAVMDTLQPDRIIVGANDEASHEVMRRLYEPQLIAHPCPYLATNRATAEIIKQASNAFLSTKISFINEIAALCEVVGADVTAVADGMGHDQRIGRAFLNAGLGFGGSCFPKDTLGLDAVFQAHQVNAPIISNLSWSNDEAKSWVMRTLDKAVMALGGMTFAVLGASFKPHTDDVRDSIALFIVESLLDAGAKVRLTDPVALPKAKAVLEDYVRDDHLVYCESAQEAITGADGVILATEWPEYADLNPVDMARWMVGTLVLDGRIQWDGEAFEAAGLTFYQVGRKP